MTTSIERALLVSSIESCGYAVEFVPLCEDAETLGFPGHYAGVTLHHRHAVKVSTTQGLDGTPRDEETICAILEHELEHVLGVERATDRPEHGLACGGRRSFAVDVGNAYAEASGVSPAGYSPSDDARQRLMLVRLRISEWSGRKYDKGASDDVARLHDLGDSSDVGRFNKILVDPESIRPVRTALKKLYHEHHRLTAPWMGEGARVLTSALYFDYTEAIRNLRGDVEAAVAHFATNVYPEEKEAARTRLGDLFSELDYPPEEEIASRFGVSARFEPLPDPDDARLLDLGETATESIARSVRDSMEETIAASHRSVVDDVLRRGREFVEKVRRYNKGETKGLRATALTNLLEVVDLVRRGLNVAGDEALDALAAELAAAVEGASIERLRGDDGAVDRVVRTSRVEGVLDRFAGVFAEPTS